MTGLQLYLSIRQSLEYFPSFWIPPHLKVEIEEILTSPEGELDMTLQLLRLASHSKEVSKRAMEDGEYPIMGVTLVGGKLFYKPNDKVVVWGVEEFQAGKGFIIKRYLIVGNRVCLIKSRIEDLLECVVWFGEKVSVGALYPTGSISSVGVAGGEVFYQVEVEFQDQPADSRLRDKVPDGVDPEKLYLMSFVVWGEEEGEAFRRIRHKILVDGEKPAYVAVPLIMKGEVLVHGDTRITAYMFSKLHQYSLGILSMRRETESSEDELIHVANNVVTVFMHGRLSDLALVSGQIFVMERLRDGKGDFVRLYSGLDHPVDFRSISEIDVDFRAEKDLVVFAGVDMDGNPGIWANFVQISHMGIVKRSRIIFRNADKVISAQLAGDAHRTEFDLVELGVISLGVFS
jgi:hypothetical protein